MAEIRINATGGVKLYDADDSHYAQRIAGTITSNTDVMTLGHNVIDIPMTTASSSATTGALTIGGGLGIAADVYIGDDTYLITDSAVLGFGADKDTTLTHTDGTGLTLNSTNKLCFNDASQFVQGSSNAILSLGATDEIDLTATAIDINGTADVSGAFTAGSTIVATGSITGTTIEPNADTSSGDNAAIGYTSAEGLILTGQGSTNDVTIKNDADTTVLEVATGAADVEITAGNLIIGTSGKGIDFSNRADTTESSGTSANALLDDYEEGSWTATITVDGGAMSLEAGYNTGSYVKIGRTVFVSGYFEVDATTASAGYVGLAGLPFASDDLSEGQEYSAGSLLVRYASSAVAAGTTAWLQSTGATMAHLRESGTTGAGGTLTDHFDAGTDFTVGITYRAAS